MEERLLCKQRVAGSSPVSGSMRSVCAVDTRPAMLATLPREEKASKYQASLGKEFPARAFHSPPWSTQERFKATVPRLTYKERRVEKDTYPATVGSPAVRRILNDLPA